MDESVDAALSVLVTASIASCPDPVEVLAVIREVEENARARFGILAPTDEQEERLRVAMGLPKR